MKILATNITGAIKKIITICRYSYITTKKHKKNYVIREIFKYSSNIIQTILKSLATNKILPALRLFKTIGILFNTTKSKYK